MNEHETVGNELGLTGGGRTKVFRAANNVVLRETGEWAGSVHALLKHLEQKEFAGAPRVVGSGFDDTGRETLTYIEGTIRHPDLYLPEAMVALGTLLREMHQACASFRPPADARWRPWFGRDIGTPDIIGHGDIAPWNIVTRDGIPFALIDWETAGPVNRLTEMAYAAWTCAQLYDDDIAANNGLPDALTRLKRVKTFADAYGMTAAERGILARRMTEVAICAAAAEVIEHKVQAAATASPGLWGIAWRTRSAAWMVRHQSLIDIVLA